jgi:hypothetical protein
MLNSSVSNPLNIRLNAKNLALFQIYRAIKGTAKVLELDLTDENELEEALCETYDNASELVLKLYPNQSMQELMPAFYEDIQVLHNSVNF